MNGIVSTLSIILLMVNTGLSYKPQKKERQIAGRLQREIRKTADVQYLLYLPSTYEESEDRWPPLLFLHGAGERGENLEQAKISHSRW